MTKNARTRRQAIQRREARVLRRFRACRPIQKRAIERMLAAMIRPEPR